MYRCSLFRDPCGICNVTPALSKQPQHLSRSDASEAVMNYRDIYLISVLLQMKCKYNIQIKYNTR